MIFVLSTWLTIGFGLWCERMPLSYFCYNLFQTEFSALFHVCICIQYSLFGSILTFGAMIGAITSGPIADYIGRKGVSKKAPCFIVSAFCISYFATYQP